MGLSQLQGIKYFKALASHPDASKQDTNNGLEAEEREVSVRAEAGLPKKSEKRYSVHFFAKEGGFESTYDTHYRVLCLDAHPSLQSLIGASAQAQDFDHSKALFILFDCALTLLELGSEMMARGNFATQLRQAAKERLGLPAGLTKAAEPCDPA